MPLPTSGTSANCRSRTRIGFSEKFSAIEMQTFDLLQLEIPVLLVGLVVSFGVNQSMQMGFCTILPEIKPLPQRQALCWMRGRRRMRSSCCAQQYMHMDPTYRVWLYKDTQTFRFQQKRRKFDFYPMTSSRRMRCTRSRSNRIQPLQQCHRTLDGMAGHQDEGQLNKRHSARLEPPDLP